VLKDKQLRFVEEYLIDTNASEAAKRAGYTGVHAPTELMKNRGVANEIRKRMDQRSKKIELKAEDILAELAGIAFINLADFVNTDGSYKDIHQMSRQSASCVMQCHYRFDRKTGERIVTGYTFWDKQWAIEMCMRHLGMLDDKLTLKHDTTENFLAMIVERAKQPKQSNIIDGTVVQARIQEAKLGASKRGNKESANNSTSDIKEN
jgi:phage terminase small subunit